MKILKELRKAINRNADYCKKELETIRRSQEKLENSFVEMKAELKAKNSRMHNAEERRSELETRMEITQSKEQTGDFPGGPVVKTSPSKAGGVYSIPGRGAKIPNASWPKKHKTEAIL